MFKFVSRFLLLLLLVLPAVVQIVEPGSKVSSFAASPLEDPIEGDEEDDDDEGQVETEESDQAVPPPSSEDDSVILSGDEEDEDDEDRPLKPSSDADTYFLFVKPNGIDLPAGTIVNFLVGFTNKGSKDFTLDTLDASFRYPMDFSYHIYNFSTVQYTKLVRPKEQATLSYSFMPSETFSARPFGLTVNLNYRDADGNHYLEAVFNETVNIVELDEGLDGETIFLYVFLVACVVLIFVAGQQVLTSYGLTKRSSKTKHVERGTSNPKDVDMDWLPKETLNHFLQSEKTSPRRSPRQAKSTKTSPLRSPRQRRTQRSTGVDD